MYCIMVNKQYGALPESSHPIAFNHLHNRRAVIIARTPSGAQYTGTVQTDVLNVLTRQLLSFTPIPPSQPARQSVSQSIGRTDGTSHHIHLRTYSIRTGRRFCAGTNTGTGTRTPVRACTGRHICTGVTKNRSI